MDPIFQEESARLSWTKEQYLQAAEDERLMLSALPRLYPNDPNLLNELLLHTHNRIVRLEQSRRKPYFAALILPMDRLPRPTGAISAKSAWPIRMDKSSRWIGAPR